MSLLFPLYLLGIAAVAAPIVFHMIRRTSSGRTPFSSLMFLRVSPPRMVRRKRLEHLPLLCLRGLLLLLLALAFARPYLRGAEHVDAGGDDQSTVVLLVDRSASMRDSWADALRESRAALDDAPSSARVGLASFDRALTWHVVPDDVEESGPVGRELARRHLAALEPGWGATDLGAALARAAEHLAAQVSGPLDRATLVLVTDLQEGARLSALEELDWPSGVELVLKRVGRRMDNAALHAVPATVDDDPGTMRVRVTNASDSTAEQFELRWWLGEERAVGEAVTLFCPPGESRVARAPARPPGEAVDRLVLVGDARPFDNVLFDRPPATHPLAVVSIGAPEDEEQGLDVFLEHAVAGYPSRQATLMRAVPDAVPALDPETHPLVVVRAGERSPSAGTLVEHARAGSVVLVVLGAPAPELDAAFVRDLLGDPGLTLVEGRADRGHALLGEVDFAHPLFRPFADPRFRDFTKIRFWHRRRIAATARALARFDDGDPFLLERPVGAGRVLVLASGWTPRDSDFARSTKFAPLVSGLLRLGGAGRVADEYLVGEEVRLSGPAGEPVQLDTAAPGHYTFGDRPIRYTVHLDPDESRTAPAGLEVLERFEVPVTTGAVRAARDDRTRQEHVRETEKRQKLWRWLLVTVLVGLLWETLWAGRLARRAEAS